MTETVSQQYIREQVTQQMQPLYEAFDRADAAPSVVEPEPVDDLPSQLDTIIESCSEAAWAMRAAPEPLDPSIFYDPFKELVRMAYAKGYDDAAHPPRAPLSPEQIDAAFRKYGTGRPDGFAAAVRELFEGAGP